ncbi:MAG TPA: hypothetical protein VGG33_22250, partial [Polyangia bacterium]
YEEKGVRCVVCHDQFGKEVKRDCPVSPPPGEISCEETKRADGTVCSTCKDAKGVVVKEGCTMPMPAPDPMGVKCGEIDDMGKRCTVCWDAQGKEIKRGCWETMGGTPTPVDPPTCKEYRSEDGAMCVICTDAKGTVVKQGCSTPGAPATR